MYRSPSVTPPTNYGGAVASSQAGAPSFPNPPGYSGQPVVGMVYFGDGSSRLSSDDRKVLKQIAEMQQAYGGVVRVIGHASMSTNTEDHTRHQEANQRISEARANAVAQQLLAVRRAGGRDRRIGGGRCPAAVFRSDAERRGCQPARRSLSQPLLTRFIMTCTGRIGQPIRFNHDR